MMKEGKFATLVIDRNDSLVTGNESLGTHYPKPQTSNTRPNCL